MDKLACMRAFCAVVQQGNFTKAAARLNTSKVLVSRNVSQLESHLGVRLLQRTTRQVTLTNDGRAYYERCLPLLEELDDLNLSVSEHNGTISGRLRLSLPSADFSESYVLPALVELAKRYPNISLDMEMSDRQVDLVAEGFDAAVRIGQLEDSSLVARKLSSMNIIVCATPKSLSQWPPITTPQDLANLPWVIDANYRRGRNVEFQRAEQKVQISAEGQFRINSARAVKTMLLQTPGIGLMPDFVARDSLASGELVQVLSDWQLGSAGIYLVYSHRRHLSPKLQKLYDALYEHLNA
ncbi:LysR family transcriptional regulator [Gilvimarinus sp. SDUM040013]|uniref:LysR family transcriptional regulator n=1 Tax=Gilvimarinus gilvus TaxID=3058038 RepID=A0ABU4S1I6_9GAMM|nr:LysR family transcriptional regulator [Gilvimarinus sp. SDUM040013]MDO3387807.1 LysR family transcriptional regulator [Gilvimarinus sp. SDUM040013]MDX6851050.1 LysR family transcriptional regulator [Gilvimarinus sp. SDUM040013]